MMNKLAPIFCLMLLLVRADAELPEIEPIGTVPANCPRLSLRKMKLMSLAAINAVDTCFNHDSGDGFLAVYSKDALVFSPSSVFIGRDAFAATFPACKVPAPSGVKGLEFVRIQETIAGNSVYYLFTVRAPGFKDYNFTTSITVCGSKIVRTLSSLDTMELEPIGA